METISKFYDKNPDVLGHRNHHFADGLCLGAISKLDFIQLRYAINEHGDLIAEGSDLRRKWIDGILSQLDKTYLEEIQRYARLLEQRHAVLRGTVVSCD
jgi:hypothetical protein